MLIDALGGKGRIGASRGSKKGYCRDKTLLWVFAFSSGGSVHSTRNGGITIQERPEKIMRKDSSRSDIGEYTGYLIPLARDMMS